MLGDLDEFVPIVPSNRAHLLVPIKGHLTKCRIVHMLGITVKSISY